MIRMIWAIPKNEHKPIMVELPADGKDVFTDKILVKFKGDTIQVRRISTDFFVQEKDLPAIINWYGMEKLWKVVGEFIYEEILWDDRYRWGEIVSEENQ